MPKYEVFLKDDVRDLMDLARNWVELGWRHTPEDPFDFYTRLGSFYDWWSGDTQFFDDFDQRRRINLSAAQYAAIWDAVIPGLQRLTNVMIGEPRPIVSGDLAVMTVQFITSFVTAEGQEGHVHTLSSLVWRRSGNSWRIIREHGSGIKHHP